MKRILGGTILSLLLAATVCTSDPGDPAKGTGTGAKGFPKAVVVPSQPKTDPTGVLVLAPDTIYVADFDEDGVMLVLPEGLVKITHDSGPMKIKARFADGGTTVETRTYTGKHIYTLEALGDKVGRVTAVFVPYGLKNEHQIKKTLIDVLHAPLPPPKPIPPDPPEPKPPDPLKSFRVIFVYESGTTLTAAQHSVIYGIEVEKYLNATCTDGANGWRRRDKDATVGKDTTTMNALWSAVKPNVTKVPCVAVERNEKVEIIPLEATPAAMVAKFKTYAEGK